MELARRGNGPRPREGPVQSWVIIDVHAQQGVVQGIAATVEGGRPLQRFLTSCWSRYAVMVNFNASAVL